MAEKTRTLQEILDAEFDKPLTDRKGKYARQDNPDDLPHIDEFLEASKTSSPPEEQPKVKKAFPVWTKRS